MLPMRFISNSRGVSAVPSGLGSKTCEPVTRRSSAALPPIRSRQYTRYKHGADSPVEERPFEGRYPEAAFRPGVPFWHSRPADEITVSAPNERVDLEALKRPRLGGKEPTRLSHQP